MATFTTDFYTTGETVTLVPKSNVIGNAGSFGIATYSTKNTAIGHWTVASLSGGQVNAGVEICGFNLSFNFLGERSL